MLPTGWRKCKPLVRLHKRNKKWKQFFKNLSDDNILVPIYYVEENTMVFEYHFMHSNYAVGVTMGYIFNNFDKNCDQKDYYITIETSSDAVRKQVHTAMALSSLATIE